MKEIWKDIINYEGCYQVSNLGNVKNYKTNKILKKSKDKDGYLFVSLYNKRKIKVMKVHRLVAQMFIPNIENKPQVNHIDADKTNNKVDNLEWCTFAENMRHAWENNLMKIHYGKGKYSKKSKIIYQINPENNEIFGYEDVCELVALSNNSINKIVREYLLNMYCI